MPNVSTTTPDTPVSWLRSFSRCCCSPYGRVMSLSPPPPLLLCLVLSAQLPDNANYRRSSDPRTRPSCPAALSFRFRFSFRMHNEQFNLENADFIRFLLFIQEMSRSIAHAFPSLPPTPLAPYVLCNYIHICQRIMLVDLVRPGATGTS